MTAVVHVTCECMRFRLQFTADRPSEEKERLVSRHGSLLTPTGHSDNCTRQVIVSAGPGQGHMAVRVLDELDLGKLMMLVHQVGQTGLAIIEYYCMQ